MGRKNIIGIRIRNKWSDIEALKEGRYIHQEEKKKRRMKRGKITDITTLRWREERNKDILVN